MKEGFQQFEQRVREVRSTFATNGVVFEQAFLRAETQSLNGHILSSKEQRREDALKEMDPVQLQIYKTKQRSKLLRRNQIDLRGKK